MTFCSLVMISVLSTPRPGAAHPDHSAPGLGSRFSLMTPSVRSSVDYCNFASFAVVKRFAPAALPQNPGAKTNLRSVSVKRRVVGEPAALRSAIQQLHVEGADRAMGGRDPVRVPYAWPRSPRERRRASPPLAVRTIPAAG